MPAILRIFVYQTGASHTVIGPSQSYGTIVGQGGDLRDSMVICNTMRCLTLLEVYAEQPIDCDAAGRYDNDVEPYVVCGFQYDIEPMR